MSVSGTCTTDKIRNERALNLLKCQFTFCESMYKMTRPDYKHAAWLCHFWLLSVAGDICPYKECHCEDMNIFCQALNLTSFPVLVASNISRPENLVLDNNQITSIPGRSLPPNMREISLTNVPIATIDDDAFVGSTSTLDTLTFQGARFTRVPDVFLKLTALKHLNIFYTLILDWNPDAMRNIGQTIDTLNLNGVGMSTWPTWIQYFTAMISLNIDDAHISSVPDNAFDTLTNTLESLSMNNGSLTSVPKALSKLKALSALDLGNNHIVDVTFLPQLCNITYLILYHNRISNATMLSNALRAFGDSMNTLELADNYLTAIPDLSSLSLVATLSLSQNRISDPHSGAVPTSVYDLDLSNNFFPSIPSIWPKLPSVTAMELSFNSITTIQASYFNSWTYQVELQNNLVTELRDTSFPPNSTVRALYLQNNSVSTISNNVFKNLPQLEFLYLSGSKLQRVPLQLSSVTSLVTLDLSHSSHLVCTCSEKSLQSLIRGLQSVSGDCGLVSIQYFFTYLSPGCPDAGTLSI